MLRTTTAATQQHRTSEPQPQPTWLGDTWLPQSWFVPPVAAIGHAAASAVIHWAPVVQWWMTATLTLCMVPAALLTVAGRRYHQAAQGFMVAAAAVSGMWLTWSTFDAAWKSDMLPVSVTVWAALTVLATGAWRYARVSQIEHDDRVLQQWQDNQRLSVRPVSPPAPPAPPPRDPAKVRWETMFTDLDMPSFTCHAVLEDGGHTQVEMERKGKVTFGAVMKLAEHLEMMLDVPPGAVTFERKKVRGRDGGMVDSSRLFLVHVNTHNSLAKVLHMPEPAAGPHKPTDVHDGFWVGDYEDATHYLMRVYDRHWLTIGPTRTGKSNLLDVFIDRASATGNALLFACDFKGGATIRQWEQAWLDGAIGEGRTEPVPQPIIAWPARDRFEAQRIFEGLIALAEDRGGRLKGERHIPTPDEPHIFLIIEEASLLLATTSGPANSFKGEGLSSAAFNALEAKLAAIGAGVGITIIKATQRASVTSSGSGDAAANFVGRAGFGAASVSDAQMVFPKSSNASAMMAGLKTQGAFLANDGTAAARELAIKAFYYGQGEDRIRRIYRTSLRHGYTTPGLRPGTRTFDVLARHGAADRFSDPERAGWLTGEYEGVWTGKKIAVPTAAAADAPAEAAPVAEPSPETVYMDAWRANQLRLANERDNTAGGGAAAAVPLHPADAQWAKDVVAQLEAADGKETAGLEPGEESTVDEVYRVIAESFSTGAGATYTEIVAKLREAGILKPSNRTQASRWLASLRRDGRLRQFVERGRYYPQTPPAEQLREAA